MSTAQQLLELPSWARHRGVILYAAGPAQRLMNSHDARPESEQRPYSRAWKPALHAIWAYAGGDDQAWYPISQAVGGYYLSPQNHIQGQDGPDDADQDEVAAVIFAANAVLHGLLGFAELAAARALDAIDNRWYAVDDERLARESAAEVDRQQSSLGLILQSAQDRAAWRSGAPRLARHSTARRAELARPPGQRAERARRVDSALTVNGEQHLAPVGPLFQM